VETPTELIDLNRILLNLARSREFPDGSSRHGYDFIAPLDPLGRSTRSSGRSIETTTGSGDFGEGEDDEIGRLVHKPGGVEHERWVFDYNPNEDSDDDAGYRFGAHVFLPGEYVSISAQDGMLHTFRVITVDPLVPSVALIESFELEITV
jgi:hypothetical protein